MIRGSVSFITDRLAVGNAASRSSDSFTAVVSLLATERPGTIYDELARAPATTCAHVLHIDIADGESSALAPAEGRDGSLHPAHDLADRLDEVVAFILEHIKRGCVLIHCGAGQSRSVVVAAIYLCCVAGMSWSEAMSLILSKRPSACPAPAMVQSAERWLKLRSLTSAGPR